MLAETKRRAVLNLAFQTAVHAALPEHYLHGTGLIARIRELGQDKRIHVIGAGKGAGAMAAALENAWPFSNLPPGVVVTRDGYAQPTWSVSILQAGHPFPDHRSRLAADHLAAYLEGLGSDDHVVMLLSGGGSSLLSKPVDGISQETLAKLTGQLMAQGVPIQDLNIVRKHLTTVLGGKLARYAYPASIDAVILSDVTGDDPATIASGPILPDSSTLEDAIRVIRGAGIIVDHQVHAALANPANETPKPGDEIFSAISFTVIPADCWIDPVSSALSDAGYDVHVIDRHADDDARDLAVCHARQAIMLADAGKRVALLSGGEATVKLRGNGVGGPNAEYALQLSVVLGAHPAISAIACDTDGTDGATDAAGAVITPSTLARAQELGLDPLQSLATSDSGTFFAKLDDAVRLGPTFTNVNDMRVILVDPKGSQH